jgi:DNA-binding XRE family transcriptional regulator
MSKTKAVAEALPPVAVKALRDLGENIAVARLRRREPQRAWAERIGISVPTYVRLEKGDPSVSMAAYAGALWLMGRVQALPGVAAPESDLTALEQDVRAVRARERVRKPTSVVARLARIDKGGDT